MAKIPFAYIANKGYLYRCKQMKVKPIHLNYGSNEH